VVEASRRVRPDQLNPHMKKENQVRANSNGPSPEVQAQIAADPVKSAGNAEAENEWFNIGLSKTEVAMLKKIQAEIWIAPEDSTRAKTIRVLLLGALAHYSALARVLFADAEYCKHEGFDSYDAFFNRKIEAELDRSGAVLAEVRAGYNSARPASIQSRKGGAR